MHLALKQRLLGAAVLIALAIIFVPMFLSNTPQQQDNATLNLEVPPPPEHKFEIRTLPVTNPSPTTPVPAPPPADANKVATVDTHAPVRVDALPENQGAAAVPAAATAKPIEAAKPAAEAPTAEAAPAGADGRFAVHLGIYADQAHADALVASLKKQGYAAYGEPTDYQGKPAQRVRVGPFAARAAAEAARLKIKQVEPKVPSSVIESSEQPTTDASAGALPANRAGGWAVQLGAFKTEAEANKVRDRLRAGGFASFVDRTGNGDSPLWRVRTGPYADRGGAEKARDGIDAKFKLKGMIVTQP
jgi:DedD protein